jgi:hypothetical protein
VLGRQSHGLVLRTFLDTSNKVILLDEHAGKINIYSSFEHMHMVGALLSYNLIMDGVRARVNDHNLIALPHHLAHYDLAFMHQLCELAYYFIPLSSCVPGIFNFLHMVWYAEYNSHVPVLSKYLILFKFFMLLGMYPEDKRFHTAAFYRMAALVPSQLPESIQDADINSLKSWIKECIHAHPMAKLFKVGGAL